jgi:hypothetical protein
VSKTRIVGILLTIAALFGLLVVYPIMAASHRRAVEQVKAQHDAQGLASTSSQ